MSRRTLRIGWGLEGGGDMRGGIGSVGGSLLMMGSMWVASACATVGGGMSGANTPTYRLLVNNRSDFEVVVYALQSADSRGYRLGNARSLDSTTISVPRNVLTGSAELVVRLHPIGQAPGTSDWVSQSIPLEDGLDAHLDIRADHRGDMALSMLFSTIAREPRTSPHASR